MTLFSTLQISNNALIASQIGLQVTGNNVANANTPGYIRQRVVVNPAPTVSYGGLLLGTGVSVEAIVQQTDRFLEERTRNASSDLANGEAQESAYTELETMLGELSDTDLSTSLSSFFGSVQDILNQPDSVSVRNLSILQGKTLAETIRRLDQGARDLRSNLDAQVRGAADKINTLLKQVSDLNVQIVTAEGGDTVKSDAVGLRDRRTNVLNELSQLVDIRSVEQPTGDVTVFVGGDYVVFQGTFREVGVKSEIDRGQPISTLLLKETDAPLNVSSGKVAGLVTARDSAVAGFIDHLNQFSRTLTFEFNKVHASGQGLSGYSSVTSEFAVADPSAALDHTGLEFTPVNGSFQVQILNKQTGISTTKDIRVDLNGLDHETSLADLAAQLDAVDGLHASISDKGKLIIESDSPTLSFGFANDTSNVLASLGINTFFSGSSASTIGVNSVIAADPSKFAASQGGIGEDAKNGELLAKLLTSPLGTQGGSSLANLYDRLAGETSQGAAVAKSVAEGFRTFQNTLEGQLMAINGVNLDEEAIRMIAYQRAFQASARVVSVISEMLDVLVKL